MGHIFQWLSPIPFCASSVSFSQAGGKPAPMNRTRPRAGCASRRDTGAVCGLIRSGLITGHQALVRLLSMPSVRSWASALPDTGLALSAWFSTLPKLFMESAAHWVGGILLSGCCASVSSNLAQKGQRCRCCTVVNGAQLYERLDSASSCLRAWLHSRCWRNFRLPAPVAVGILVAVYRGHRRAVRIAQRSWTSSR